jgi:hypothetical protein
MTVRLKVTLCAGARGGLESYAVRSGRNGVEVLLKALSRFLVLIKWG